MDSIEFHSFHIGYFYLFHYKLKSQFGNSTYGRVWWTTEVWTPCRAMGGSCTEWLWCTDHSGCQAGDGQLMAYRQCILRDAPLLPRVRMLQYFSCLVAGQGVGQF